MTDFSKHPAESGRYFFAWLAAMVMVVLGAKFWVIQLYGTDVPYWDQWDDASLIFKPWLEGHLTWSAMFTAHNEHRIVFTRLLDLAGIWLNGQWDPRLQTVINAGLHAGWACFLAYALWSFLGRKQGAVICALLIPFFALPFDAENTTQGFQSQMYFLSIFSLSTILGLGFGKPLSGGWLCGLGAAVMSLFTMGSGLLAALAVTGLMILRVLKQRRVTKSEWITGACALAVFGIGLSLNVTVEHDKPFQAHSFSAFFKSLVDDLAWPFWGHPAILLFICLPLILIFIRYLQAGVKNERFAEFILVLGFWGLLQALGLAYGRANWGFNSRYMDTLCTIPIAGAAGWLILVEGMDFKSPARKVLVIVWAGVVLTGVVQDSRNVLGDYLPWSRSWGLIQEENIRAFESSDNAADLSRYTTLYWSPELLAAMLRDPKLLGIMPAPAHPQLKLEADEKSDDAFVAEGYAPDKPGQSFTHVWGDYPTNEAASPATFISKPMTATLPKLLIPVICCGPDTKGASMQLVEESTGRKTELTLPATGSWQTIVATAPRNPFRIYATSPNRQSWLAVGDIREAGRLSLLATAITDHAVAILSVGLGFFISLAGWVALRGGIDRGPGGLVSGVVLLGGMAGLVIVMFLQNANGVEMTRHFHIGWAVKFAASGDAAETERQLRDALWLQPDDPETLVTLANVVLHDPAMDKNEARRQAIACDEAILRLRPGNVAVQKSLEQLLPAK